MEWDSNIYDDSTTSALLKGYSLHEWIRDIDTPIMPLKQYDLRTEEVERNHN